MAKSVGKPAGKPVASKEVMACSSQEQLMRSNSHVLSCSDFQRKPTNEDDEAPSLGEDFLGDRLSNALITEEEAFLCFKEPTG